ncbi:MAG: hypothetical protein EOM20_18070 [Spartobacteria bacterium]|nr:hypothetical protein [Spartobacteria bacterium]
MLQLAQTRIFYASQIFVPRLVNCHFSLLFQPVNFGRYGGNPLTQRLDERFGLVSFRPLGQQ